ncbi:ATP-grasp domain-containing protein [uncultured Ruegeria sp.]|uniref:ATP-grasp domain-containing protein n=1 Tax=uncultured Ruegeria sp. TaxID=259304 RepID=UPI0026216C46|nr:ATP-grasp domain-containing protein [uncultured Ruegeria sp.]
MNARRRILITGIGALIGQGIASSLRDGGRSLLIGLDRRMSLYGAELCDEILLKPMLDESSDAYLTFWRDLVRDHRIELIIPGISIDMVFLDAHRSFFEDLGVALALNTSHLIALTENKSAFAGDYAQLGLPVIPSVTGGGTWEEACTALGQPPFLLKPSTGEGSVGIARLHDVVDFDYWSGKSTGEFLVQRIVGTDDDEYTVGTFGFGDGDYIGPLIFQRRLTRAGNTGEARTAKNGAVSKATDTIMRHYKPLGPTNLQFRMEGEDAYLLEINPRFSSSCSLRTAFGFNEAEMCIDLYLNQKRPAQPVLRDGVAQRHNADRIRYAGPDL